MSKSIRTVYGNRKEILKFNKFVAVGVTVSDVGVTAVEGKKTVPAGTIVAGEAQSVLLYPTEPVTKNNSASAEGVLLSDVDVTYGPGSGSMVIHGFIDLDKLPEPPATDALESLNMIKFMR